MKKSVGIIFLVISISFIILSAYLLYHLRYEGSLDPSIYCESSEDCTYVNLDCTDCTCNNIKLMNTEYAAEVCKNIKTETQCDIVCETILKTSNA